MAANRHEVDNTCIHPLAAPYLIVWNRLKNFACGPSLLWGAYPFAKTFCCHPFLPSFHLFPCIPRPPSASLCSWTFATSSLHFAFYMVYSTQLPLRCLCACVDECFVYWKTLYTTLFIEHYQLMYDHFSKKAMVMYSPNLDHPSNHEILVPMWEN